MNTRKYVCIFTLRHSFSFGILKYLCCSSVVVSSVSFRETFLVSVRTPRTIGTGVSGSLISKMFNNPWCSRPDLNRLRLCSSSILISMYLVLGSESLSGWRNSARQTGLFVFMSYALYLWVWVRDCVISVTWSKPTKKRENTTYTALYPPVPLW